MQGKEYSLNIKLTQSVVYSHCPPFNFPQGGKDRSFPPGGRLGRGFFTGNKRVNFSVY